jgi:transcriptional regulator with XRE-family HTH domain
MTKENFQKALGAHLKRVRKKKGISIRELELRGSVERATLSQIENGLINPTTFTLKRIFDALEISCAEFFKDSKL